MNQFFLQLAIGITGFQVFRMFAGADTWRREVPLKAVIAAVAASACALLTYLGRNQMPPWLEWVVIAGAAPFVFGPLLVLAFTRGGLVGPANGLSWVLYWTADGRAMLSDLIGQQLLSAGRVEAAIEQFDKQLSPLNHAAALCCDSRWQEVLQVPLADPPRSDQDWLLAGMHLRALQELKQDAKAYALYGKLQAVLTHSPSPVGNYELHLAAALMAAQQGRIEECRQRLGEIGPGLPEHSGYYHLGRAHEVAGDRGQAVDYYQQAYARAPAATRYRLAKTLRSLGTEPPAVHQDPVVWVTPVMVGVIAMAYAAQYWLEREYQARILWYAAWFVVDPPAALPEGTAWWRYLSYALVHGNLVHVGFNLWVLYDLGQLYEKRRRGGAVMVAFLAGTVAGAALSFFMGETGSTLGASGGVLGVAGALLADVLGRSREDAHLRQSLIRWMGLIAILSFMIPVMSRWGHLGGVIGGFAAGYLVLRHLPDSPALSWMLTLAGAGVSAYTIYRVYLVVLQLIA